MRIGQNSSSIISKYRNIGVILRPLGLIATLLIIDLSVQPDCHYGKLIYNSLDGSFSVLCLRETETKETPRILAQFIIKRNYMYMNKV